MKLLNGSMGLCLMVDDCSEDAMSCYTRLLELDPANSLAHFGLGKKAFQDKKYEDAINSFGLGRYEVELLWSLT